MSFRMRKGRASFSVSKRGARAGYRLGCLLPATLLGVAVAVIACGGGSGGDRSTPAPDPTIGKYEQTWTKSYADTTCLDWNEAMDSHQRFVMAGDMLTGARNGDGASGLPPEAMINSFEASIDTVCDADTEGIVRVGEVAASLYLMSSDFKP